MTTLKRIRAEIEQIIPIELPYDKRTPENIRDMALDIIDKYAEQEPCDDAISRQAIKKLKRHNLVEGQFVSLYDIEKLPSVRPKEQTDEWQDGYDMAWEEAKVFYEKEEPTSPCDLCMYNPPSSADGKPCALCPAEKGGN